MWVDEIQLFWKVELECHFVYLSSQIVMKVWDGFGEEVTGEENNVIEEIDQENLIGCSTKRLECYINTGLGWFQGKMYNHWIDEFRAESGKHNPRPSPEKAKEDVAILNWAIRKNCNIVSARFGVLITFWLLEFTSKNCKIYAEHLWFNGWILKWNWIDPWQGRKKNGPNSNSKTLQRTRTLWNHSNWLDQPPYIIFHPIFDVFQHGE